MLRRHDIFLMSPTHPSANQQDGHFHWWVLFDARARDDINASRSDSSEIKGNVTSTTIPYDYLVFAVGAEVQTFGIPGVKENACFMKELADAERVRFSAEIRVCRGSHFHSRCKGSSWTVSYFQASRKLISDSRTGIETAAFPGQSSEEIDRLLHMVCF
jgi:NADH:ubiquinone reductase (non-electrogenic)